MYQAKQNIRDSINPVQYSALENILSKEVDVKTLSNRQTANKIINLVRLLRKEQSPNVDYCADVRNVDLFISYHLAKDIKTKSRRRYRTEVAKSFTQRDYKVIKSYLAANKIESIPIETLELKTRTYNALYDKRIRTVEDIIQYTATKLGKIKNLGSGSLSDVKDKLYGLGLRLYQIPATIPDEVKDMPIADLKLNNIRTINRLKKSNIKTVGDSQHFTEGELISSKNFGKKSSLKLKRVLKKLGVSLSRS